tara:strand:+ start:16 stop:549 length:534 start_codon:yes stop_codon:yes gene_type:complete
MNGDEILGSLKNEDSKQDVLSKLTQTNDLEIIQEMIALFDDNRIEIRGEVFSSLFLNDNDIFESLVWGTKHESKSVRAYVTLVLANRNEKRAIKDIQRLTNDSSGLVRTCAYGALGHLKAKECKKELHEGVLDLNIEAVKSAVYALARIDESISKKEREGLSKFDDPDFEKILKFFN